MNRSIILALDELVSKAVNEFANDALSPDLLGSIAMTLACDWATYWQVDPELMILRPSARWKAAHVEARKLERDTVNRTLSMSEGNAGHVWRSRKPIWTQDLLRDMCLPRSLDARAVGLQGGVWFAVKTGTAVYGIVELLGHELQAADDELLRAIERLGMNLGQLVESLHRQN